MTGINAAELRNVCKVRKDFKRDNVSFKLPSGTITGFVGENGAGKTTVIELILDIIKRDSGEILVFGMDNITHRSEIHEDIGVVFDTVKFPDTLTACAAAIAASDCIMQSGISQTLWLLASKNPTQPPLTGISALFLYL